jgi:hypothetical protein
LLLGDGNSLAFVVRRVHTFQASSALDAVHFGGCVIGVWKFEANRAFLLDKFLVNTCSY